jgi:predicted RNA polymerase sigma factor
VPDAALDPDGLPDDELRLLFLCCHPRLSQEAQVTLTLKTLCGFSVAEIARGLLAKETAIAQRLVRARATLRETGTDFSLPPPEALEDRLEPALRVLYLLFNEGYSASEGPDVVRGSLCGDAAYLAGLLAKHPLGDRPEVHALLALMCFHASRLPAREAAGELLLLADQDRGRWDRSAVLRGFHHLERAMRGSRLTDYHLEAGIASCHARAASLAETDWAAVVELYDLLLKRSGSPVVALNRAVAVGMLRGPAAGLAEAELLRDEPALRAYHFLPAVLGDFHARLGNLGEAARHFARAHALTHSVPERTWLQQRVDSLSADSPIPYTLTPTP